MNVAKGMHERYCGYWGVPLGQMRLGSRFPLQVLGGFVPQPPVGFPLQSLTRTRKPQLHRSEGLTFARERELH
jgi:hypothetical protein